MVHYDRNSMHDDIGPRRRKQRPSVTVTSPLQNKASTATLESTAADCGQHSPGTCPIEVTSEDVQRGWKRPTRKTIKGNGKLC